MSPTMMSPSQVSFDRVDPARLVRGRPVRIPVSTIRQLALRDARDRHRCGVVLEKYVGGEAAQET